VREVATRALATGVASLAELPWSRRPDWGWAMLVGMARLSAVDASLVTGESMPAEVGPGDPVTGATVNMSGRLVIKATQVGADTLLAQITRLVSQAQATKAGAQRLADRIAAVFVPCVIAVAVATLGFWLGVGLPAASALTSSTTWPRRRVV